MKKILAVAAVAAVAIGCMAFTAFAEESVTITGGLDTTAENFASGDGYTWNADTKTLTLDNVSIEGGGTGTGITVEIIEDQDVTINLIGKNYIKGFNKAIDDIVANSDDLDNIGAVKITGGGSLEITDCKYAASNVYNLVVDNATVDSYTDDGFLCYVDCEIRNGSTFNVRTTVQEGTPIYCSRNLIIDESTVTLEAEADGTAAILGAAIASDNYSAKSKITITDSEVTLKGKYFGIFCGRGTLGKYELLGESIEIINSTVNVESAAGLAIFGGEIKVDADSKLLSESNRQMLRAADANAAISVESGAVVEGYTLYSVENIVSFDTDYTLKEDFTVSAGRTLTIPEGVTLTLADGASVFKEDDTAKIINNGTVAIACNSDGTIEIDEGNTETVTAHSFTNYVYNNDAKIGVDGTETAQCDYGCGETDTRTAEGTALADESSEESSDVSSEESSSEVSSDADSSSDDSSIADSLSDDASAESSDVLTDSSPAESKTSSQASDKTDGNPVTGAATGIAAAVLIAGAAVTVLKKR